MQPMPMRGELRKAQHVILSYETVHPPVSGSRAASTCEQNSKAYGIQSQHLLVSGESGFPDANRREGI
jgi:hypothetical protein